MSLFLCDALNIVVFHKGFEKRVLFELDLLLKLSDLDCCGSASRLFVLSFLSRCPSGSVSGTQIAHICGSVCWMTVRSKREVSASY